ncbi:phosphoribosylaminoimidazolesuccinocarboxamide synthase [Flammeovirga agarivorans]|uniref:Phosphoribosylaminoimidazole-succinocarboxamide synthase n=1 Tax=Flammeovirga agarivorans TaxID=2726742 RepID=A0A7X8XUW0_9BACT|nr:phosphoribosylaminoimidazolesuccinocarboxamide synthase [Flammeovirga agarivorans]NLR90738.1 phosphoribosylaminoimidazolesuccinocarboxamide synthase [Flammeovirga agarivorans]
MDAIKSTDLAFENATNVYKGKVRDVYFFDDKIGIVASDRISAFDVILERAIPYKGQVLNQIAEKFLKMTSDIVPNWFESAPHPNVHIGKKCDAFAVEMVIRGYLAGHAWREYRDGKRELCGVPLPEGLKENDKLPHPIITPSTKATEGHDEDISREEILKQGIVSEEDYKKLEEYTYALFAKGQEFANERGLILVDTKYEFGKFNDEIFLIDEVHTPDSSRYFYADGYQDRQDADEPQKQLSKEFVRQWLIENGFQGKDGQKQPFMSDEFVKSVSDRYIELFENITGEKFEKSSYQDIEEEIFKSIKNQLG